METRIREHIRTHVVGYVALFIAIGGTAYASHPGGQNTISSPDIINGEVKEADIASTAVHADEIAQGAVGSDELANGQVTGVDVANDNLTGTDIAANSLKGACRAPAHPCSRRGSRA